jgi:hypothetical protein
VVIDTQKDWVRLTAPVKARVSVYKNGQWVESGKATLPAGWYAGPGKK